MPGRLPLLLMLAFLASPALAQQPDAGGSADMAGEADLVARLTAVRQQLVAAQAERARQAGAVERSLAELAAVDRQVAERSRAVQVIAAQAQAAEQRLEDLQAQQREMEQEMAGQERALAALLRSAYALGRLDTMKLLLAQDRLSETGRLLAYQAQMQRVRSGRLQRLAQLLAELSGVREQTVAARDALLQVREREAEAVAALQTERARRSGIVRTLRAELAKVQQRLEDLDRDRSGMESLLEQLRSVIGDVPALLPQDRPFSELKGRLPVPLTGRVVVAYGQAGSGGRASAGMRYAAERGTPIRAVARGRVAFADWLRGYGLLLILDHGDGYMSLYGHCESLLKSEGEWVEGGESLAQAGDSGGNEGTGLYFELRHRGRALDPRTWLQP